MRRETCRPGRDADKFGGLRGCQPLRWCLTYRVLPGLLANRGSNPPQAGDSESDDHSIELGVFPSMLNVIAVELEALHESASHAAGDNNDGSVDAVDIVLRWPPARFGHDASRRDAA